MKKFFKILFLGLPFKKELFFLMKKIWAPPKSVYQHLYFKGIFDVKVDSKTFRIIHEGHKIENDLFWGGIENCWEKNSIRIWRELAKNSKVIFDIGANTGVYSLIAKTVNTNSSVHAFEPFPPICNTLTKNAALNHYDILCNCTAISNYTGTGFIFSEDPNFAYSVTVNQNLFSKKGPAYKIPINTITLKDYIKEHKIGQIDLMKIDVETHEPEVMEGFAGYFLKFKPIILVEILNEAVCERLRKFFTEEDFDFYNIHEVKGIKKVSRLTKSEDFNFLIVPAEKSLVFNLKKYFLIPEY